MKKRVKTGLGQNGLVQVRLARIEVPCLDIIHIVFLP